MKSLLRALGNVFLTVLVMLLIVYGWAFLELKILLKGQPEIFGFVFYMQESDDMAPQFESKDVIVIKKGDQYKAGDIVLYFDGKDSTYKVHQVVSLSGDSVTTKCAKCTANNEAISTDNVVGRAVGKVLFMGAVVNFFKQKSVLIGIAIIGLTFLAISQYLEFKPKKKKTLEVDQN